MLRTATARRRELVTWRALALGVAVVLLIVGVLALRRRRRRPEPPQVVKEVPEELLERAHAI
jgi:anti-sigma-K factor RskA